MVRTVLQASTSRTAVLNGTEVSVAAKSNPTQVLLNVTSLTSGSIAIFEIQTSADNFVSDIRTEAVINVKGPITEDINPFAIAKRDHDMPGLRVGTASTEIRIALTYISAGTVVYEAFLVTGA